MDGPDGGASVKESLIWIFVVSVMGYMLLSAVMEPIEVPQPVLKAYGKGVHTK